MVLQLLIVDDHEVAREGLAEILNNHRMAVAGSAGNGADAIKLLQSTVVDAVLLDIRMPEMDGLVTLEAIRGTFDKLPVIMISTYDNPTYIARAAALGATDFVLKSIDLVALRGRIEGAANGDPAPPESRLVQIRQTMRQEIDVATLPPELPLTGREAQVLCHIALGLSNKEIARSLEISVETVKEHVQNILRKIGANDRTDAAVRAIKLGLVD